MKELASVRRKVDRWNNDFDVGQTVDLLKGGGEVFRTRTKSPAEVLSGHTSVVWLEGVVGFSKLDSVRAVRVCSVGADSALDQREALFNALSIICETALLRLDGSRLCSVSEDLIEMAREELKRCELGSDGVKVETKS